MVVAYSPDWNYLMAPQPGRLYTRERRVILSSFVLGLPGNLFDARLSNIKCRLRSVGCLRDGSSVMLSVFCYTTFRPSLYSGLTRYQLLQFWLNPVSFHKLTPIHLRSPLTIKSDGAQDPIHSIVIDVVVVVVW